MSRLYAFNIVRDLNTGLVKKIIKDDHGIENEEIHRKVMKEN